MGVGRISIDKRACVHKKQDRSLVVSDPEIITQAPC